MALGGTYAVRVGLVAADGAGRGPEEAVGRTEPQRHRMAM